MADSSPRDPRDDEDTRLLVASGVSPEAFADLYLRNADLVAAYLYRRTHCAVTSNELAAETFASAYASRLRYDPALGTGISWLLGIAANLYREWARRGIIRSKARRSLKISTPQLVEEDLERIESLVDSVCFKQALSSGLHDLSPSLREAVILRIGLDLSYEEAAAELGCSVGAARVRVSRALAHLQRYMGDQHG
jgi:RNA polymerase sigma factor (sigma-70 family)